MSKLPRRSAWRAMTVAALLLVLLAVYLATWAKPTTTTAAERNVDDSTANEAPAATPLAPVGDVGFAEEAVTWDDPRPIQKWHARFAAEAAIRAGGRALAQRGGEAGVRRGRKSAADLAAARGHVGT